MAHDVKLVEQDRRLWRPFPRRVAKRLPHVHHRQANAAALLLAQPIVELRHARLRAIFPAEPDRPPADQVAHLAIATSCPIQSPYETQKTQYPWGFKPHFPLVSSTRFPDEPYIRKRTLGFSPNGMD